ncbi:MAG TPA: tail fiber domain-containing protein [Bacteroidia bacterium]|nr:tail fiber domain-containing protein [Bacteroidia bacterium]HRS58339.1 tail fiber domain-containing protein [Bacteroidia bacterium]HRU69014.1 tail fiber domain-containing protein [Bacteroidia bacterium]
MKPIANSLDIINKITPHTYYFKTEDYPMHKFSSNVQYGFIAQELETILPSLVKESVYPELRDEKGNVIREKVNFKAVNYDQLIPILTQGIKEQQLMIENMQKEIQLLKQNIELFENNSQLNKEMENDIEMEIIDKSENNNTHAKLYQNTPNPFSKSTKIEFYIPIEFNNALICITDLQGIILKKYNIINQGNGSIMVKQKDLKSGIYLYSLIIDNQVIDTRKMILE